MSRIPAIERLSPPEISAYQLNRVRELLSYAQARSPFYRDMDGIGKVSAASIRTWDDFARLPTTCKDDLQGRNWDFLSVPRRQIVEYTSTSGTLGKPVTIALTEKDRRRLAYNESISFACADGSRRDLYQLMLTLDRQFMAGIAYYEGIRKMGAGLVRVGPGLPALQWETIGRLRPTALVAVPSFLVRMIEYAQGNGIDLNRSGVEKAICIGESLRTPDLGPNALAKKISGAWKIRLYGTYASTEMQTAFTECFEGKGGHFHPELIAVEILDHQGKPVPHGEAGEVTVTTLGVEGMPLLRYRTGDIAAINAAECSCGRKTWRLGPVIGRKQQMIKLRGTTVYPPGIFEILQQAEGIRDYVVEATTGPLGMDELTLHIHVSEERRVATARDLQAAFQSRLRVVPEIVFATAKQIETLQLAEGARKIRRFVDSRQQA